MAHTKGRSSRCAFQPRPKKKPAPPAAPRVVKPALPASQLAHYQLLLRVFASAYAAELAAREDLQSTIQDVKKALYERDFAAAFENEEGLAGYAARWSPTRALCYAGVLAAVDLSEGRGRRKNVVDYGGEDEDEDEEAEGGKGEDKRESEEEEEKEELHIVALGGGAAELAAYASLRCQSPAISGSLTLIDSAPWTSVLARLETHLSLPPLLSKYASASAHAANAALMSPEAASSLHIHFSQADLLALSPADLRAVVFRDGPPRKTLVTLLFTLNELYAVSRGKTTLLLLALTEMLPIGSGLLVLDSPGSYSEAAVGKEMRRYPMRLLVEHTLLREERGVQKEKVWEQVETEESVWFRLPEGLEYPIQLENMRYQKHLYKLVKPEKRT
ncbi:hypothetical protein TD95_000146 [Thielaviopsis punctulata]|uniref:25S rRNA (Uridine(2843)-N(3))-methyltransferase n=1 Tax=Thielaviopsis punctulata TaxID=72032 RepID=A0A0F4Z9A7_9PEZI|nr:hypothetical protein TD95_000146 [Thielaviopsis punctulata]